MKKNLTKFSIVSILVLSSAIFVTGCQSSETRPDEKREGMNVEQENDLTGDRNINENTVKEPNRDPLGNDDLNKNELSDKDRIYNDMNPDEMDTKVVDNEDYTRRSKLISDKLTELDGVNNATVLLTGDTALIGLDIPADTQDDKIKEIKDKVEHSAKNTDKDIDRVAITADADVVKRIENMGSDIKDGKPISGFATEIKETIKRITPNM